MSRWSAPLCCAVLTACSHPPAPSAPAPAAAPVAAGVPAAPPRPGEGPRRSVVDTATYVRTTAPSDARIRAIWMEGMQRSQAAALAQVLIDSVGPRLTGSPGNLSASDWALAQYKAFGISARREQYGTWNSWRRGPTHLDLLTPRVRTLEATQLAWSPSTGGKPVNGDVIALPDVSTPEQFTAWLPQARGKFVLISPPQYSCRSAAQWTEFGTPASREANTKLQDSIRQAWPSRVLAAGDIQARLLEAGAAGALTLTWSQYPGIDKIFGTPRQKVPTLDVVCEDYGLLMRLVEHGQHPTVRLTSESEFLGEQPVFNTIAEIKGSEKPNEYIVLSAHFDSWDGSSGATDNGTGTVTMMEALRILRTVYPSPKRTIIVGHWSGEEQGLNGSRAFSEDHPEVVAGLQALFNQDNGTGRVVSMGPGALPKTGPVLLGYLKQIPAEISGNIKFQAPSAPAGGGSDNASFACYGAPAFGLGALGWDYGFTTWHTNRDTYDKLVIDDLKNNATLVAMLAYLASEDPTTMSRERLDPLPNDPRTGKVQTWAPCVKALRMSSEYKR